jgi:hypothetical protein
MAPLFFGKEFVFLNSDNCRKMKTTILRSVGSLFLILFLPGVIACDSLIQEENQLEGDFMIWSDFDGPPIDVYVDNSFSGTITGFFSSTPECNSDGCVTVSLEAGTYDFYAEEQASGGQGKKWSGTITVRASSCGALGLSL